ncbi:type VII secretion integral membrane protein EccD [Mycobacterium intracellulare]|uniref:type VII secretion integral membrane protein EccD n=1 Tax=Mycobacterium intracellulare TaxID=1767 RepID=UPI001EEE59FF|nr:type VII secretion integral membrane protein EccD [Mycobacterium intracellulare]MEE3755279.1 type VII secretion integral membrane protein EccD [Mycobacterium intracellulare]
MSTTINDEDRVSVSVTIPRHSIDMVLPRFTPAAAMMTDLVERCKNALDTAGRDTEFFAERTVAWHLERFGGESISAEDTLDDAGVRSGDRIFLKKGNPTEVYPELIDDHAEFIAQHQTTQFASWSARYSRPLSAAVLLVCAALALIGLITFTAQHPHLPALARYSIVGGLVAGAALMFAITFVCDYGDDPDTQSLPRWGFWVGYGLIAAAAAAVIPRAFSVYTIVVVAVVLATLSVIFYGATKRYPRIHVTVASASLLAAVAPLLSCAYPWPPVVIAAQTMALGLAVLSKSDQIALSLAKINLPYIAANGESYIKNLKGDVSKLPLITQKDETLDSIFHQKERVGASRYAILAVTIGFCISIAAAAFFVGLRSTVASFSSQDAWWLAAAFVVLIAVALVFRGLCADDAALQAALWIAATATMIAFIAGSVAATGLTPNVAIIGTALTLTAALTVIVSIRQISLTSNSVKRCIDILEGLVYFLPYFILGWSFMGLYHIFRAW